jgi:hypothetical protein
MSRKAQALLELALFVSIMLMILLTALNYQRNMREQKLADENVFNQTVKEAYKHVFIEKDIDDKDVLCSGAVVSYSLNIDRQANRIFQGGQRRSVASSASVYYSNAESPTNLEYSYYNNIDIGPEAPGNAGLKKSIYVVRPGGTADPEDDLKLTTLDYIAAIFPAVTSLVDSIASLVEWDWWAEWGGWIALIVRTASFGYLVIKSGIALSDLNKAEDERAALKPLDDQMGDWGWRICDITHDGSARAGRYYVKNITAQVYDIETEENKSIQYGETQQADKSTRDVNVGHVVKRKILRRFDESQNPTLPLSQHTFNYTVPVQEVTIDLSGVQSETWN